MHETPPCSPHGADSRRARAFISRQLDRRDEALAISAEGVAYLRKLSADNPDVPAYRDALASALGANGKYLGELERTEQAVSLVRQAAETLETKRDPDVGALAEAAGG